LLAGLATLASRTRAAGLAIAAGLAGRAAVTIFAGRSGRSRGAGLPALPALAGRPGRTSIAGRSLMTRRTIRAVTARLAWSPIPQLRKTRTNIGTDHRAQFDDFGAQHCNRCLALRLD
jgi:hypothetical protein